MATDHVDEAADRLYGLALEDFTRERDARSKELRKEGEREAADAVKALAKPSQAAWAINRLWRDRSDEVEELLAAGERLRAAQDDALSGGDAAALRDAAAAERRAVDALVTAAGRLKPGGRKPTEVTLERVRQTLRAAAADEEVRAAVAAGRVVKEAEAAGAWPQMEGWEPPARAATPKAKTKAAPKTMGKEAARQDEEREEAERREAERREAAERRKELEEQLAGARRELREADRAADLTERKAKRAAERLERALAAADEARAEAAAATADRDHAVTARDDARDAVARLEEALD
jgi:hypothetical protein